MNAFGAGGLDDDGGNGGGGDNGVGGNGVGGDGVGGDGSGGAAGGGGSGSGGDNNIGGTTGGGGSGGGLPDAAIDVRDASVVDTGADVPVDRPIDRSGDAVIDTGPDVVVCDTAHGFHRCGDTCVSNSSIANCGPTSCVSCPVPANSTATCDGTMCGFTCSTNFTLVAGACVRSCDPTCATTAMNVALPGGRFTGTTAGTSLNAGSCGGSNAPEAVYQLVLTQTSDVFVTTHGSKFDTVIYMRRGCCGAEIACNDNADGRTTSVLNAIGLAAGTYDIFVDGAGTAAGAFTVDIYTSPTSAQPGESCGRPMRIAGPAAITGNTCAYRDDYSPQGCGSTTSGLDEVFYFVLDATTTVSFDTCTNTCIDSVLYIREVCTSNAIPNEDACNDDACSADGNCFTTPAQSSVTRQLGPGAHYVVLDTFVNAPPSVTCGLFTLTPGNVPP